MDEQTMTPVIAVLAYRRAPALNRLLNALDAAHYPDDVQLIISLEGGASPEVVALAKQFRSNKFNVKVLEHDRCLGLREHVLACGDLALEYGSVIVLEDDLFVDPFFYQYASSALQYYDDADLVAGIALYKHERNEYADLPFTPMGNGYSTYLMQLACSWGQCWSKKQWLKFKEWYKGKDHAYLNAIEGLPLAAKNWPESSWKKYFHGFLIETKRFFVYPYEAYSTNCSDEGGEHISNGTIFHQVSMGSPQREFVRPIFVPVSNTEVLYDAYMEPIGDFVWRSLGLDAEKVEVDMQGIKPKKLLIRKQYTLTSKKSNNPIRAYEQSYKPPEMNMMFPVPDSKSMSWILAKSVDVKENKRIIRSVESYSYYVGINLMSRAVIKALLLGLPGSLMRKLNSARWTD
ncbi:glycosyltransferase family A protein [Prosthecochloris sp. CIB 2401]|uniref:glycosyltransferase family A protein n=1 Tax=Prosthecochloris sp. CIB 2401 TaxID=1868325 RepID=UPI00080AA5F3|nr:glycosyltransferase family A protein [Prosthecochloris sp. CIB 2401]ANT64615.1 hypothetical protein Ptc2401_00828 [Prosthecochloris sp. CIB 2401]